MADQESFVRRWSRRKSAAREHIGEPEPAADAQGSEGIAPPSQAQDQAVPASGEPEPAFDPKSLPDIESLTYESDFTAFMRKGVPAELRRQALQRLWRSSPTLANLDGLLEYGDDYTKIGTTKSVVRTAYRVGRGMLSASETLEETAKAGAGAPEPAPNPPAPTARSPVAPADEAGTADTAAASADSKPPQDPGADRG